MNDDLNSPVAISVLFDWVRNINQLLDGSQTISSADLATLRSEFAGMVGDILGLCNEKTAAADDKVAPLMDMILEIRAKAKADRDWTTSDLIRNRLTAIGIRVKDNKDGRSDWEME